MKTKLGQFFLDRTKSTSRKRKGISLHTAKEVWVFGIVQNETDLKELKGITSKLRGDHGVREVKLITYAPFSKKSIPEWYERDAEHIAVAKKDLNWKGLPDLDWQDLKSEKPELFLDLIKESSVPLEWLWKIIPAQMKVTTEKSSLAVDADLLLTCAEQVSLNEVFKGYEEILTKYNLK